MRKILASLSFILSINAAQVEVVKGTSVVLGKISTEKKCSKKKIELFVTKKRRVVYQIPVVDKGDFMAHLVPGNYAVVAIGKKGCLFEKEFKIKADSRMEMNINLSKSYKKTSSIFSLISDAHATALCVECMNNFRAPGPQFGYGFGGYPMQQYGYRTPWWGPFGHYSFMNFRSPCYGHMPGGMSISEEEVKKSVKLALSLPANSGGTMPTGMINPAGTMPRHGGGYMWNGGCGSNHYPGGGNVAAGKPVVYFHGKKGQKFNIKLTPNEYSNFLATSPIVGKENLSFEIAENGGFNHGSANYDSLFYDVRSDGKDYQNTAGKCIAGKDLLSTMVGYMKESGFKKNEIKDFTEYWSAKLPKYHTACVYPQVNDQVSSMAKYEVSPKPDHILRLLFVIVPEINNQRPAWKFSQRPKMDWRFKTRLPARRSGFHIREWGVSFLMTPTVSQSQQLDKKLL